MDPFEKCSFRYFLLADIIPVRVMLNPEGLKCGAQVIDPKTGELKLDHTMLSRLEISYEAEEIDRSRFHEIWAARRALLHKSGD